MTKVSTMTIGCDLGDRFTHLCVLGEDGRIVEQRRVRTTPNGMESFFRDRAPATVVVEVGTHSRWVAELVGSFGHEVIVANPRQVQLIYGRHKKTDRSDAELLARLGRADRHLLAPVRHRSRDAHTIRAMIRARDVLVRERVRLINHVRGIVKPFGARVQGCTAEAFHHRAAAQIPTELVTAMTPILTCIQGITEQIRHYDRLINETARAHPDAVLLQQVNGIGTLTALAFVVTLEDPTRFRKSRDVGGFLGLVPRKDASGQSDPQLRITKAGDPYLRRLLVNCAQHVLGPHGADSDLRRWGLEMAKRGGGNAKKRAVVAVARKLAVLLHRLWVTGESYERLGYAQQRLAA